MSTERHRRLTAAAAKRAIREGRMWYQQRRIGGAINDYMNVVRQLADAQRAAWERWILYGDAGLLDDREPRVVMGVDHGTAEPTTTTVAYVAEGGRVRVVPEGWPWTPEMSEEVQRNMRQTQALFRGANERPEDLVPEALREEMDAYRDAFRRNSPRVEQQWTVPPRASCARGAAALPTASAVASGVVAMTPDIRRSSASRRWLLRRLRRLPARAWAAVCAWWQGTSAPRLRRQEQRPARIDFTPLNEAIAQLKPAVKRAELTAAENEAGMRKVLAALKSQA